MTDVNIAAMSPTQAEAHLDGLSANGDWGRLLLAGDPAARAQWRELTSKIAGDAPPPGLPDAPTDGFTSVADSVMHDLAAPLLASVGAVATAEALSGRDSRTNQPFDSATVAQARAYRDQRMSDSDWCRRLMQGGHAERRELRLWSIILMNEA